MQDVCVYHNADLDGYCSAAIWLEAHHGDGELIGMNYGDEIPWASLRGRDVTLVDFSFEPWSEMLRLEQEARSVTWIDHHKSAIAEWTADGCRFKRGRLDVTKAACELTWLHYHPGKHMPFGVFLLGDYDCWRFSDPYTLAYQMGMRVRDMDPGSNPGCMDEWQLVFGNDSAHLERILNRGRLILAYKKQQDAKAVKAIWFPVYFEGLWWMAANRSGINSLFWDSVWDNSFDGKLAFYRDAKSWRITLYSDTVDCSVIAKQHGGGGHAGAAGFRSFVLPFELTSTCFDDWIRAKLCGGTNKRYKPDSKKRQAE